MTTLFFRYFTFSSPVSSRQGVLKNTDLGGQKGEDHEQKRNGAQNADGDFGITATCLFFLKVLGLIKIGDRRRDEENGNVDPIGRSSNDAVVGVEDDGDQNLPQKDSAELDTPKIFPVTEETALHNGKQEHGKEEELHVLPG